MKQRFKVGDRVIWNELGGPSGSAARLKLHTKDLDCKGYHSSRHDPQYEIKSDKTDHVARHKGMVLRRARRQA